VRRRKQRSVVMDSMIFHRGLGVFGASVLIAAMVVLLPNPVFAEIKGRCSQAVGTFLTKNALDNNGRSGTSRSVLVLTNGGHALRFDSDEDGAAMDSHPFGDSAGIWRCDGVDTDGSVRLSATMLDFTFPDAEGEAGQIARIDVSGRFLPKTGTIAITLRGARIELPPTE
jgi:hypothetical protein